MFKAHFLSVLITLLCGVHLDAQKKVKKAEPSPPKKQQTKAKPKTKFFGKKEIRFLNTAIPLIDSVQKFGKEGMQYDLPDAIIDRDGNTLITHLAWDGQKDRLILAKESNAGIRKVDKEVASGVLHAPALASEKKSAKVWVFWGTTSKDTTVNIMARSWEPEKGFGTVITVADSKAAEAFLDAGTDAKGRVWVTWQSFRAGEGDIYARYLNPDSGKWSKEIPVSTHPGGDWEPRIAFDPKGNAWIIYDSSPWK
jgi:hypothetical protein